MPMSTSKLPTRRVAMQSLAGFAAAAATRARAQATAFPERAVRIIPFGSAGGPIDGIARAYADKLKARWGQPVLVETKPGASGVIAADFVAKASPDGHTLLLTLPLTQINVAVLNPKLPYDPQRDFAPIAGIGAGSPLLLARADAPFSDVKEFVAFAKAKPGTSYGTWGIGSGAHLYGELLKRQAGIEVIHVPYKDAGYYNDLFGGLLAVTWSNPGTARGHVQAGKVKVLGVAGSRRMSLFPQVPTFAEQGFSGFDVESWVGVFAPAKTPPATLAKLTAAWRELTALPDLRAMLLDRGFDPVDSGPAELAQQIRSDTPKIAELIKAAGVTAE